MKRPEHLRTRQVAGRAFSETIQLLRTSTTLNAYDEPTQTENAVTISCATAPGSSGRARQLAEEGVALSEIRDFWLVREAVAASRMSVGDVLIWAGDRYRVDSVQDWGTTYAVVAVRIEDQP